MSAIARKSLISLATFACSAIAVLGSTSAAQAGPKRVGIDRSFGSRGFASVPLAGRGDFWSSTMICAAGTRGALIAAVDRTSSDRFKSASLIRYGSAGSRLWTVRMKPHEVPLEIHPSSRGRWIVAIRRPHDHALVRYLDNGRRDQTFGDAGRLALPSDDMRWLRDGRFVQIDTATVYTKDGKPDKTMHGDGRIVTGFPISDVLDAGSNMLFVLGQSEGVIRLAKISRRGSASRGWNGGTPVQLEQPPISAWKSHVLGMQSDYVDATADEFEAYLDRTVGPAVDVTFSAEVKVKQEDDPDDELVVDVRRRLTHSGAVDTTLRRSGWQFLDAQNTNYELEAGDDEFWVDRQYLEDGRKVHASFLVGSEQDPGSWSMFNVSDKSGRYNSRAARIFKIYDVRFDSYDFDKAGRTMYFCGVRRFSHRVIGRVRL